MTQNDDIYIRNLKAALDEFDGAKATALAESYVRKEPEPYRFLTHIMKEEDTFSATSMGKSPGRSRRTPFEASPTR